MAFTQEKFAPVGGQTTGAPALYSYISSTDSSIDVTATGYFVDKVFQLNPGDVIIGALSNGHSFLEVLSDSQSVQVVSGGGGTGWQGTATNYAALPAASNSGDVYLVLNSTVSILWNRRAGLYLDTGTWNRVSNPTFQVVDNEAVFADDLDNTKKMVFQIAGVGSGQTRTITMPDNDVDLGDISPGGGNEFDDSLFRVQDNADATKEIALEASNIATGTTRTITMPDRNIDMVEFDYFEDLLCTGFIGTPPTLSINGGDNSKFDITGATILVSDSSTTPPALTEVTFGSQSAVTPTFLATDTASFISIDSSGSIVQRDTRADAEERRDTATVGLVSHIDNLVIEDAVDTPQIIANQACNFSDLARALGFFSTSGNAIAGIASGLTMSKTVGTGFALNETRGLIIKTRTDLQWRE